MAHKRQPTPVPRDLPGEELTPEQWLGRALRAAREERGLSQEQVAQMMHVYGFDWHQTQVGRSESATRPIRVNEAVALAEVLRIHPADLIGDIRDDWAAHTHILRLYARKQRLEDRISAVQQELKQIQWDRDQLEQEIQRAQDFHAESHKQRDRGSLKPERVRLKRYTDVREAVGLMQDGRVIVLDTQGMLLHEARSVLDFAAGLAAGTGGSIARIQDHILLLCPPGISQDDVIQAHAQDLVGSELDLPTVDGLVSRIQADRRAREQAEGVSQGQDSQPGQPEAEE